jgi:uncharacterized delta-60 repeat protein
MHVKNRLFLLIVLSGAWALAVTLLSAQPGSIDARLAPGMDAANQIFAVSPTPDGKILIGGIFDHMRGLPLNRIARLNADGQVDSSFQLGTGASGAVISIAVQANGKILIGGYFSRYDGVLRNCIGRLNTNGTLDSSFDPGTGVSGAEDNGGPFVSAIAIQSDGKILVGGLFNSVNGLSRINLARLNPDGSLDPSFRPALGPFSVEQLVLQSDRKILAVTGNGQALRLNDDGSQDSTFNPSLNEFDWIAQIALQADGRILLGGSFADRIAGSLPSFEGSIRALTLRLNPDGGADPTFIPLLNRDATIQCRAGIANWDSVLAMAVQNDGKIVLSGAFSILNGMPARNVARLNPDGTVDGNFDSGSGADGQAAPMVLDQDGNVLITGCFTHFNGVPAEGLIRLLGGEPAPSPPVFKIQPVEQVLNNTVVFAALIAAFPSPKYQWQLNGIDLPGATHPELILTNLSASNAGSYQFLVTNLLGSAISEPVVLRPPDILVQPSPQTVDEGRDTAFSVAATNSLPLSFQWQFQGANMIGATNAILLLNGVRSTQAGNYTVVVSNSVGSITSAPARLDVVPPQTPVILVQPLSRTIEEGEAVSFGVVATNNLPLSFQWQFNATNIPGATQSTLTFRSAHLSDAGIYRVVVSSEFRSMTSDAVLLVVKLLEPVTGPGVVTNVDQASLEAAMSSGSSVTFGFNGIITLTNTLYITTNITLDGTGRSISLDGGNAVRHFVVTNGVTLRLINMTLINGKYLGADGQTNEPGNPGWGGAIFNSGGTLALTDCKFINNQVSGGNGGVANYPVTSPYDTSGGPAFGGAIYSTNGRVFATNCLFASNSATGAQGNANGVGLYTVPGGAAMGGAVFSTNSVVCMNGVTFTNNLAKAGEISGGRPAAGGGLASGGALADAAGTTALSNCVFVTNQALGATKVARSQDPIPNQKDDNTSGSANGGAVFHDGGTMFITGTLFMNNAATGGGGANRGLEVVIAANGNGGALFNQSGGLELRTCAFVFNQANGGNGAGISTGFGHFSVGGSASGGGIYNLGALTTINCTLAGNSCIGGPGPSDLAESGGSAFGGGIFNRGGTSLLNVTVAVNSVQAGSSGTDPSHLTFSYPPEALGSSISETKGTAMLTNTILFCAPTQTNVSGTITDGGHNICSDASASFSRGSSRNNLDPFLAPLADNGGLTPTMALLPSSPAVDAGDDSACPPTDQRGVTRPQGLACDIGAFELAPKLTLARGQEGVITIDYAFQAGRTNRVMTSTNLIDWLPLGTTIADGNGISEFKDSEAKDLARRFYRIEILRSQ